MSSSNSTHEDGFDFIRKMWGNMGVGLPGVVTPTLDVDELERRIKDLQAVEGWLKMNLGMLQMTIQGLEVQRATLAAMQAMSQSAGDSENSNPFANPALWTWPFGTNQAGPAASGAPEATTEEATPPAVEPTHPPKTRTKPKQQ